MMRVKLETAEIGADTFEFPPDYDPISPDKETEQDFKKKVWTAKSQTDGYIEGMRVA
jgi:hypothetical protein